MPQKLFSCFLTLLILISMTLADIYDNCGDNGDNCLIQNKGNKPDPDSGSGDCLAEKNCRVIASFDKLADGRIKFELEAQFEGADDGNHWTGIGFIKWFDQRINYCKRRKNLLHIYPRRCHQTDTSR